MQIKKRKYKKVNFHYEMIFGTNWGHFKSLGSDWDGIRNLVQFWDAYPLVADKSVLRFMLINGTKKNCARLVSSVGHK